MLAAAGGLLNVVNSVCLAPDLHSERVYESARGSEFNGLRDSVSLDVDVGR
jgi:hypothetical protein